MTVTGSVIALSHAQRMHSVATTYCTALCTHDAAMTTDRIVAIAVARIVSVGQGGWLTRCSDHTMASTSSGAINTPRSYNRSTQLLQQPAPLLMSLI